MIEPDLYLDAPLSMTEIEGPAEDYYEDDQYCDPWDAFKAIMYQMYLDEKEHGFVDDYYNELLEYDWEWIGAKCLTL